MVVEPPVLLVTTLMSYPAGRLLLVGVVDTDARLNRVALLTYRRFIDAVVKLLMVTLVSVSDSD